MRRILETLGWFGYAVYNPQVRTGRSVFAAEFALWAAVGVFGYAMLGPIADAEWISDEALTYVARAVTVLAGFWNLALFPLTARRCHDLGLSGAWALLHAVPGATALILLLGVTLTGRSAGRVWPERTFGRTPEKC